MRIQLALEVSIISIIAVLVLLFEPAALPAQMRGAGSARDSAWVTGSSFTLEANGKKLGVFHRVSGMSSALMYHQWSGKLPRNWGSATLFEGSPQHLQIFEEWRKQAMDGRIGAAHRRVIITVNDGNNKTIGRYALVNAWPIRLTYGPTATRRPGKTVTVELGYEDIRVIP